jgi:hypothetical protein
LGRGICKKSIDILPEIIIIFSSVLRSSEKAEKTGAFSCPIRCFMTKYGKKGNQGGSKDSNRTGKSNPNSRAHGEDVSKESHRTGTQKYGGHKSGPRR